MKTLCDYLDPATGKRFVLVEAVGTNGGKTYTRRRWLRAVVLPSAAFEFRNVRQRGVVVLGAREVDPSDRATYEHTRAGLLTVLGWHATPEVLRDIVLDEVGNMGADGYEALRLAHQYSQAAALLARMAIDWRARAHGVDAETIAAGERALTAIWALRADLPPDHPWRAVQADDRFSARLLMLYRDETAGGWDNPLRAPAPDELETA